MKPLQVTALALLAGATWIGTVIASRSPGERELAPLPSAAEGTIELLEAHPFVLDEPYVHEWRVEKPLCSSGYLLVLKVDPELARPRQTYEAVLYVGDQTAQRCNAPEEGGNLIVLVPAPLDDGGRVALDLDTVPIWFGTPELPERVDAQRIRAERALARRMGVGPAVKSDRARLRRAGEDAIHVRAVDELQGYVDDLIQVYSPGEQR